MKFWKIFLVLLLTSCSSTTNKLFFNKKLKEEIEVQLIKSADYKIDISDYEISNEIDSIMKDVFHKKNIKLVNTKSKYVMVINRFYYQVLKERSEVLDSNGFGTGNYGIQLNIQLELDSKIMDTLTKKEKEIKWNLGDVKPVHSDLVFDFFAVDSEDSFSPSNPLKNCFNMMSHRVVKFIEK